MRTTNWLVLASLAVASCTGSVTTDKTTDTDTDTDTDSVDTIDTDTVDTTDTDVVDTDVVDTDVVDTDVVEVDPCDRAMVGVTVPLPLAWWTMDAGSITGTTVADARSIADGTMVGGPTPVAGVCGEALDLDGVDDFVRIDNEAAFDFDTGNAFTIAAWVKVHTDQGPFIFGKADNDVNPGGAPGYYLGIRDPGNDNRAILDVLNDPGNLGRRVQSSTGGYADDAWHHVIGIYDGSNTVAGITFVIDGQSVGSSTILNSNPGSILNNVKPAIGIRGTGAFSPQFRPFSVDEVAVWNSALTVPQAQALYTALGGT